MTSIVSKFKISNNNAYYNISRNQIIGNTIFFSIQLSV